MTDTGFIEKAVSALLSEKTFSAAARKIGVSVRTLRRVRKSPEFEEAFLSARSELVKQVTTQLTVRLGAHSLPAVETLRKIFSSGKASPASRTAAAAQTIRLCLDSFELQDLESRISALERQTTSERL